MLWSDLQEISKWFSVLLCAMKEVFDDDDDDVDSLCCWVTTLEYLGSLYATSATSRFIYLESASRFSVP